MAEARFALILHPSGTFDVVDWPADLVAGLNALAREFSTTAIATFGLWPDLSLWTDVDMMQGATPLNRPAMTVHSAFGYDPEHYYGTAALTGGLTDADDGTHAGLTLDDCHELLKLAGIDVPKMPQQRTK